MAMIIPFITKHQLETEKAVKVMRKWEAHLEWEDVNWQKVVDRSKRRKFSSGRN